MPRDNEQALWTAHKSTIRQLYIDENRKLADVMSIMANEHDFGRTKSQYERNLMKWGFAKYSTSEKWRIIGEKVNRRKAEGRPSKVRIDGRVKSDEQVRRATQRHQIQNTYQRAQNARTAPQCPSTPPGVTITTPTPPSSLAGTPHSVSQVSEPGSLAISSGVESQPSAPLSPPEPYVPDVPSTFEQLIPPLASFDDYQYHHALGDFSIGFEEQPYSNIKYA